MKKEKRVAGFVMIRGCEVREGQENILVVTMAAASMLSPIITYDFFLFFSCFVLWVKACTPFSHKIFICCIIEQVLYDVQ